MGDPMQTQEMNMWPWALVQGRTLRRAKYSRSSWKTASAPGASSRARPKTTLGALVATGGWHSSFKSPLKENLSSV